MASGAGSLVGSLGVDGAVGLAFDAASGSLFGTDTGSQALVVIDRATAASTPVGSLGYQNAAALAFDAARGVAGDSDAGLISVDTAAGTGTTVGALGFQLTGLATGSRDAVHGVAEGRMSILVDPDQAPAVPLASWGSIPSRLWRSTPTAILFTAPTAARVS